MEDETVHQELRDAEKALQESRFDTAEHLLDMAAHAGATPLHISDLGRRVRAARAMHDRGVRGSVRVGFLIALAGYLILSARQPLGWTPSVWIVLAFVVIPGVAGLFVGRRHAGTRTRSLAFYDGVRSGVYAMACYSAIHIFTLANNLEKDNSQLVDEWAAAFIVVIVYSIIAGGVAGMSSVAASFLRPRGDTA
jgi:ABC-type transport system involved in cytochrome c biogenesis permease subunit